MRKAAIAAAVAAALAVAGCGETSYSSHHQAASGFSSAWESGFMNACTNEATDAQCGCAMDEVEQEAGDEGTAQAMLKDSSTLESIALDCATS